MLNGGSTALATIAVASGKGGVGKTNLSTNLSVALARSGRNVLLMDADLGLANVDLLLGLSSERNISHVLDGECELADIVLEGPAGIRVIPATSGVQRMAQLNEQEHGGLITAFSSLPPADALVVDTGAGIADNVVMFCKAVQHVMVVVCDEPASMTDAYALIKVLNTQHGVNTVNIVTNMVNDRPHGERVYRALSQVADKNLDVDLRFMGAIPTDQYIRKANRARQTVVEAYPLSKSSRVFSEMAKQINRWPDAGAGAGQMQFFIERLIGSHAVGPGIA